MHKRISLLLALALLTTFCATAVAAEGDDYVGYQAAISDYFDVSLDAVATVSESKLSVEEWPVLFYIAQKAEVDYQQVLADREKGQSWHSISSEYGLNGSDYYVHYTDHIDNSRFARVFKKFQGLDRDARNRVQLADDDYVCLVNLRFLYKHYNYSQRLIVSYAGEGKAFREINDLVYAATADMRTRSLAETN